MGCPVLCLGEHSIAWLVTAGGSLGQEGLSWCQGTGILILIDFAYPSVFSGRHFHFLFLFSLFLSLFLFYNFLFFLLLKKKKKMHGCFACMYVGMRGWSYRQL